MSNYTHQWDENQFRARVENLSKDGFISRLALRSLMDNRFASPSLKMTIHEMLSNNLRKQQLHLKFDLGIDTFKAVQSAPWSEAEVFQHLGTLIDKQLYEKNDNRWTVETISRSNLKELLLESRLDEVHHRSLSVLLERNPSKKIFKPQEVESYLRKRF
jgi:hypothetical protein